jgi:uncharacterized protein YhjY with autotransporter beta-barrel domain
MRVKVTGGTISLSLPLWTPKVYFDNYEATCDSFSFLSTGLLTWVPSTTCTVPSGPAVGTVSKVSIKSGLDITILSDKDEFNFLYTAPPGVSSLSPSSGYSGSSVQVSINGAPPSGSQVMFGSSAATCSPFAQNGTIYTATCTVPAGTAGTAASVYLQSGTDKGASMQFNYLAPPAVSSLSPSSGYAGTSVTVTAAAMPQSGTQVMFGSSVASCSSFTQNGSVYSAVCSAPAAASAGAVNVFLTNGGADGAALPFTYLPPPSVSALSPSSGYGGTSVTITVGSMPQSGTQVMFDSYAAACTSFSAVGPNFQAVCSAPSGPSAGAVSVFLQNGTEQGASQSFTYLPPPAVLSLSPSSGYDGTIVTVKTAAMPQSGTQVMFGSTAASCGAFVLSGSNYEAACTAPSEPAGPVNVFLTDGAASGAGQIYTYLTPVTPSNVSGISPLNGYAGDTVTVTTASMPTSDTKVYFGAAEAACGAFVSNGSGGYDASCVVPSGTGAVAVTMQNSAGSGSGPTFTYDTTTAPPALSSVAPTNGLAGDNVTVTASAAVPAGTQVMFGSYAAACSAFDAVTFSATCAVPSGPVPGSVSVTLQNSAGTGAGVNFTYNTPLPGSVTGITPPNGNAGDNIIVSVAQMPDAGTQVMFGSTAAVCSSFSASGGGYSAMCTVPAGTAGSGVTVALQNSAGSGPGQTFTYNALSAPSAVTGITPASGAAGTTVAVTTAAMPDAGTQVMFGSTAATCSAFTAGSGGYTALCAAPSGPADGTPVTVLLQNAAGSGTGQTFTYSSGAPVSTAPVISSVTPASGWTGTPVTVTGSNLNGASVTFGGKTAVCTEVSSTQLTCAAPAPDAAGAVSVVAATSAGFTDGSASFTYDIAAAPAFGAQNINVTVSNGAALSIDLSKYVTGGPAQSAALVGAALDAAEGTASLSSLVLTYTPSAGYSGTVTLQYNLTDAYGRVSNTASITITVSSRPDPTQDAQVKAMAAAQIASAQRYARAQTDNFLTRLRQLRGRGENRGDFKLALGVTEAERNRSLYAYNDHAWADIWDDKDAPCDSSGGKVEVSDAAKALGLGGADDDSDDKGYALWLGGAVHFGSERSVSDMDYTTTALSGGLDKVLSEKLVAGIGLGYTHDKTDVTDVSTLTGNSFTAAVYATYALSKQIYIDGLLGYNRLSMDSNRYTASGYASGTRQGDQIYGSAEAGYVYRAGAWQLSPFSRFEAAFTDLNSYSETGAGSLDLTYADTNVKTLGLVFGLETNYRIKRAWGSMLPKISAEYMHNFAGNSDMRIGYADTNSTPYSFSGAASSRNSVRLGTGADFSFNSRLIITPEYRIRLGENSTDHAVSLRATYPF